MRGGLIAALLGAALLAGCGKADFTPPKETFKTPACKEGCANNALVVSADGRYVAVSSATQTDIYEIGGHYSPTTINIGVDKLASSPDGRFLLVQHALKSPGGVGIRIFRFDIGQAVYRDGGVITGLLKQDRHSPFRKGGEMLEVSPDDEYSEVLALDWRYRRLTSYSVRFSGDDGDYDNRPRLMAVSEDTARTAWSRLRPGRDGVIAMFGYGGVVKPAETAWPERPDWRTFSFDGSLYGAESKGRVAFWNPANGKIVDRMDKDGVCVLSGAGGRMTNQLSVVCTDKADAPANLKVWLFPGKTLLAEVTSDDGWTIRDWRVARVGKRLAVLETRPGADGAVRARVRLFGLDVSPAPAPIVIDLGDVTQPQFLVMAMSGSGKVLAVRLPNGHVRVYEPGASAEGSGKGS